MSEVRVCTLVSGSSANCTFVRVGDTALLIDAGAGIRKTEALLNSVGSGLSRVCGIFLTHEHSDHVAGLKTITKKHKIPILGNEATLRAVANAYPEIDSDLFCTLPTGASARRDGFSVTSFACMHDSAECVGYTVETERGKIGIATDLGELTESVSNSLKGCSVLVFESNHDENLLRNGPYPYPLRQRIAGPCGHLSNTQSGEGLRALIPTGVRQVFLAHLSKENNTPDLCLHTVRNLLSRDGIEVGRDVKIQVAPRSEPSEVFEL